MCLSCLLNAAIYDVVQFAIGADVEDLLASKWVYIMLPVDSSGEAVESLGFRTLTQSTFELDALNLVVY